MMALHRQWLAQAGAQVAANTPVEINPLWAGNAAEVKQKLPEGTAIDEPTYFSPAGPRVFA